MDLPGVHGQGAAGDVGPGEAEGGNWGTRAVELTFNDCIGGDLRVTKECKPDDPLLAGQTGTCTILVDNLGPGSALDVVLTDEHVSNGIFTFGTVETTAGTCTVTPNPQANEGTVTCELGRLSPGERVTIKVPVSATTPQNVNDIATVSSSSEDPDLSNNQDEDGLTVVAAADLQLTKTDAPDPVVAGTNLTYTLTARNNGPSSAAGVVVEDFLPSGVSIVSVSTPDGACVAGVPGSALQPTTCNLGTLAPLAQEVVTIVVQVLPQTVGSLQNSARVSSSTADPDNSNDLATSTTTVTSRADLSLVKADSPDPVSAGAELTYVLTVSNAGPSTATGISLADTLPAEVDYLGAVVSAGGGTCLPLAGVPTVVTCSLGSLDPGGAVVVTLTVRVKASVPNGTVINQVAAVSSTSTDPNLANNGASASTTVLAVADIWLDKTGGEITGNLSAPCAST